MHIHQVKVTKHKQQIKLQLTKINCQAFRFKASMKCNGFQLASLTFKINTKSSVGNSYNDYHHHSHYEYLTITRSKTLTVLLLD